MLTLVPAFNVIIQELGRLGEVSFRVLKDNGTVLADVTLEGNHRIDVEVQLRPHGIIGRSIIYRKEGTSLTELVLGSAFGTAYARAADQIEKVAESLCDLPIEVGDFVECQNALQQFRGVVTDIRLPRGATVPTGYFIQNTYNGDSNELYGLSSDVTLLAKGSV